MRTRITAAACTTALGMSLLAAIPADAAAPTTPAKITGGSSSPGPRAGELTIRWHSTGADTTGFRIETGLTTFSPSPSSSLPTHGRHWKVFSYGRGARSATLSASQTAAAGAGAATGFHLYFRVFAVHTAGSRTTVRAYPYLQAAVPRPASPKARGTQLRVASFNVRTAKASGDARSWRQRVPDIARLIKAKNPGVVALQELGPGRADGKAGSTTGVARQTDSLVTALRRAGASRYRLVRTTSYVRPGIPHSTQGARILYDTTRYALLSHCPDMTGKSHYNTSCSMDLPRLHSDPASSERSAAYAQFADRRTGKRFWLASVHLDSRHSSNLATERRYEGLRRDQVRAVDARIASLNAQHEQVVLAGDMNTWQNNRGGDAAHDYLMSRGFYDSAAALTKVNFAYPTINHFDRVLKKGVNGYGVRLDVIATRGSVGARRFENVMKVVDSRRPSDHNMILSDLVL